MNFCNYSKSQIHDILLPGINQHDASRQEEIISIVQTAICGINERVFQICLDTPDSLFDRYPTLEILLLSNGYITIKHPCGLMATLNP